MGLLKKLIYLLFDKLKSPFTSKLNEEIKLKADTFDRSMGNQETRKNNAIRSYDKEQIKVTLAGVSYRENVYKKVSIGDDLEIRPEPNNQYDKNALAVFFKGELLGYVPRNQRRIIKSFQQRKSYKCTVYTKYSPFIVLVTISF